MRGISGKQRWLFISPSRFIDDVILKQKVELEHIKGICYTESPFALLKKVAVIVIADEKMYEDKETKKYKKE